MQTESEDKLRSQRRVRPSEPSQGLSTPWGLVLFSPACLAKARARRDADLAQGAPIWNQGRQHIPPPPTWAKWERRCVAPAAPPRPPPWEPALGLSFSHLHARLGAPRCSHPGVGPPLAIWGDFMALWPDPGGRKDGLALHPRQLLGALLRRAPGLHLPPDRGSRSTFYKLR